MGGNQDSGLAFRIIFFAIPSATISRTVVSKDLGHLVPPFASGKTKEVRAEFPAGRPLLISTFAFAAGAPVPPTFLCPGLGYVRFGSLADISERITDVRFTPESGHSSVQLGCPKSAMSGHSALYVLDEGLLAIEDEQKQIVGNFEPSREDQGPPKS